MAEVFSGEDMARQSFLTLWQSYCEKKMEVEQLRGELSLAEEGLANYAQENERLKHRCNALAYLHYGHYLVQRTRQSVQADIEACESALTALRAELATLPEEPYIPPPGACPAPIDGKITAAECVAAGQCGCNPDPEANRVLYENLERLQRR